MKDNSVQRCDFRMHDMIDGKFRVERVLNSTRTSQRFKVNDTSGNEYILKLLKFWEVNPGIRQKMLLSVDNEFKSCQIKSNYLTNIIHTGVVNGNPYLLMEYCKSVDLSQLIRSQSLNKVKIAKEILYGLRDLHKSGKVHCQLTPENILITDDNHVKLTNYIIFGDRANLLASKNKIVGQRFIDKTLAYRAPELYRLERCVTLLPTVDIFSFGVILFQLLTGELPYGKIQTESDWINYQSRAKNNDWNKSILLRNEQQEMWMGILNLCLSADSTGRAKNIDEIIEKFPADCYHYESVVGSQVEVPDSVQNGIMLHVMQGDDWGKFFRLSEIMQYPRRIITVGRADDAVFNMIQLSEHGSSYVSRRHCTIELDDETDTWYLRDGQWDKEAKEKWMRSLNGTYINSEEVTEEGTKIIPGDIISIGDIKIRVEAY